MTKLLKCAQLLIFFTIVLDSTVISKALSLKASLSLNCQACKLAAAVLHKRLQTHQGAEELSNLVEFFCKLLNIEDDEVCHSVSEEYEEEFVYVFNQIFLTSNQICGLLHKHCGDFVNPIYTWDLPLPNTSKPAYSEPELPPAGSPTLRVLHLSDAHIDYDYSPGAEADCNEPLCCRALSTSGKFHSDIPKLPAGYWGTMGQCDVPVWTVEKLFEHISRDLQFDYIIWTGDLPTHSIWNQTKEGQLEKISKFTELLKKHFPNKTIYATVGNHESAPADSFPAKNQKLPGKYSSAWLYNKLAADWLNWLPNVTISSIKRSASYVVQAFPGLRIISFNRNYCDPINFWGYLNQTDPDGVLQWLINELDNAERAGDKVHIIGHEPSCGKAFKSNEWVYYKIINRYEGTVAAQFFGHTHLDHFKLFFKASNPKLEPRNVMFIGPSITTYGASEKGHNPSFRVYTIDGKRPNSTWAVLDHETYYLDIAEANKYPNKDPVWKKEYSLKEAFGLKSGFPRQMGILFDKMKKSRKILEQYNRYYITSSAGRNCKTKLCFWSLMCSIVNVRHDSNLCKGLKVPLAKK